MSRLEPRATFPHVRDVAGENSGARDSSLCAPIARSMVRIFNSPVHDDSQVADIDCVDTTCVYEQRRSKPGLKTGAVDALSRRLGT
jgi:hypothetical protein